MLMVAIDLPAGSPVPLWRCIVGWGSYAEGSDPQLFRIKPASPALRQSAVEGLPHPPVTHLHCVAWLIAQSACGEPPSLESLSAWMSS